MRATKKQLKVEETVEFMLVYSAERKWHCYASLETIERAREWFVRAKKSHPSYRWRIVRRTTKDEVVK